MSAADLEEGSECPCCREGRLDAVQGVNCSCHLSPPCDSCLDTGLLCAVCGWRLGDDIEATS